MKRKVIGTLLGVLAFLGSMFAANTGQECKALAAENVFEMTPGGSIRILEPYGLRFQVKMSADIKEKTEKVGMLIFPADYLVDNGTEGDVYYESVEKLAEEGQASHRIDLDLTEKLYKEDGYWYGNGAIVRIKDKNMSREFAGIAYYEVNGTKVWADTSKLADTTRSASQVALLTYADKTSSYSEETEELLLTYMDYLKSTDVEEVAPERYRVRGYAAEDGLRLYVVQYVDNLVSSGNAWTEQTHLEAQIWHSNIGYGVEYGLATDTYCGFWLDGSSWFNNDTNIKNTTNNVTIIDRGQDYSEGYRYEVCYEIFIEFDNNLDNPSDGPYSYVRFKHHMPGETEGFGSSYQEFRDGNRYLWQDSCASYEFRKTGFVSKSLWPRYGITTNNNGQNINQIQYDAATDSISINMKDSSSRTFAALYENGVPVQGNTFAVTGHVKMANTKTTGSAASKVEFQIYKNTNDYVKVLVYRYESGDTKNYSVYVEGADSQKCGAFTPGYAKKNEDGSFSLVSDKQNNLPEGDPYEVDYKVIYENGTMYLILGEELVYSYEGSYADMGYAFGVRQYADVTWTNTRVIYDEDEVAKLAKQYRLSEGDEVTMSTDYFSVNEESGIYTLNTETHVADTVQKDEQKFQETYYRVGGTMINNGSVDGAQSEIVVKSDDTHAVRFVLERTDKGYYQVFTEEKVSVDNWTNQTCIVNPNQKTTNIMNFDVVVIKDTIYLLINDEIYYSKQYDGIFESSYVTIGGQNVSMKASALNATVFSDEVVAEEYISSKETYSYVSTYRNTINNKYDKYFGEDSATVKGGTLLLGSSTIDFWGNTNYCGAYDWQSTTGLTDGVNGYNVGIGGTIVEDWLYAYDKLIKPFEASKFVIFIGGNNITIGDSASYTAGKVAELLEKIHTDFPNSEIYYIYSLPIPARYANGAYTSTEYEGLINQMKTYCNSHEWVTGVDAFDVLTTEDGQNPKEGIWKSDGVHQNEEGYRIWSEYLKNIIFKYAVTVNGIEGLSVESQAAGATVEIDLSGSQYTELASNEDFSIAVKLVRDGSEVEVVKNGNVYSFTMPAEPVNICSRFAISGNDYTIITKSSLGYGNLSGIVQDSETGTVTITSNSNSTRYFGTVKMGDEEVCGTDYTFTAHLKAENCALSGSSASKIDLQVWSKNADGTLGRSRRPNIYRFPSNNRIYEVNTSQEICKTNACTYDGTSEFEADIKFIVKGDTVQLLLKIQGETEYTCVFEYTDELFENGVYLALGAQYIKVTFSDMVWTQGGAVLK